MLFGPAVWLAFTTIHILGRTKEFLILHTNLNCTDRQVSDDFSLFLPPTCRFAHKCIHLMHRSISKSHISLSYLYLHHLILRSVLLELVNASTSNLVHATQSDTMLWWNTMPSYATWCENMLLVGIQYHHPVSSWCPEGKNSQAGILSSNIYRAL